jgi:cyclase
VIARPILIGIGLSALVANGAVTAQAPASANAAAGRPAGQPEVRSRRVQGNVWLINAGFVNVAAQIGDDGVLIVDTGTEALGEKILAEVRRLAGDKIIRFIINTHAHPDHTGGNATIARAGRSIIAGNFAGQAGADAANAAKIVAHENTLRRLSEGEGSQAVAPSAAWPTDTFFTRRHDMFFNGEAVQVLHRPNAHSDGDVLVYFRKSDVIAAGDLYVNTTFPVFNLQQGGSYDGVIAGLNHIIELTVPKDKQEGGTYVVPGHGRIADEADVVEYRDMATIIRDRFKDAIAKKMTLEQVKAARLLRDYEGRYGASQGFWTTDAFIEAAYRSLR